mgnify:CR=1 FL=1
MKPTLAFFAFVLLACVGTDRAAATPPATFAAVWTSVAQTLAPGRPLLGPLESTAAGGDHFASLVCSWQTQGTSGMGTNGLVIGIYDVGPAPFTEVEVCSCTVTTNCGDALPMLLGGGYPPTQFGPGGCPCVATRVPGHRYVVKVDPASDCQTYPTDGVACVVTLER